MSHGRRRLASTLTTVAVVLLPGVADAAPGKLRWTPCHADVGPRFECAVAQVPLDYDQPRGRVDLARADPAAGHRSHAPDRLAVPQPGWARAAPASTSSSAPGRSSTPKGPGALRPRRLRPARHHPQHAAALLRQPRAVAAVPDSPFPLTRDRGAGSDRVRPRARPRVPASAAARSATTCRPRTWRATWTCCATSSATASSTTPASPTAPTSA